MRSSRNLLSTLCVVAWIALAAPGSVIAQDEGDSVQIASPPRALTDFELTDHLGQARKLSNFQGAPLLVFFGFANCPDVCPSTLNELRMLKQSPQREIRRVQVAFISVDGDRDTPARLQAYLEPISRSFVGLTGSPAVVRRIAAQFSAVFFKGAADKNRTYQVQHTSQIYLVNAQGKLAATFKNATNEQIRAAIADVSGE